MDLFANVVPEERQHPIYRMLQLPENSAERDVLSEWANGFVERDGKFVIEFQMTFESCFWELYQHAVLKEIGGSTNFRYRSPDFVTTVGGKDFILEATICASASGAPPPYGLGAPELPSDLNEMNRDASLRISNGLTSKVAKFRDGYRGMAHVMGKPFVIGLGSFDRPNPHLSSNRTIMLALYGQYYDEEATIAWGAGSVVRYPVGAIPKREGVEIPMAYFARPDFSEVSAVLYSPVATWGKVQALADKPDDHTVFVSYHPREGTLAPDIRKTVKRDYSEHLLDGLYVFHNLFARHPLDSEIFSHNRVAQMLPQKDGEMKLDAPEDFLLMRHLMTL